MRKGSGSSRKPLFSIVMQRGSMPELFLRVLAWAGFSKVLVVNRYPLELKIVNIRIAHIFLEVDSRGLFSEVIHIETVNLM